MPHPFLDHSFPIRWSLLTPDHVEPDISLALEEAQRNVSAVVNQDPDQATFESAFLAFERATERLGCAWRKVEHLKNVCDTPELRAAYHATLPKITEFYTNLFFNESLWRIVKTVVEKPETKALKGADMRFVEETIEDFRDSGADLSPEGKKRLAYIQAELALTTQKFSENVLDATNAWELVITDEKRLGGLPESAREVAHAAAKKKGVNGWRFTLQEPSYVSLMRYADDADLRRQAWEALQAIGRCAPQDNRELLGKILSLRQEKAERLGFGDFSDLVLHRRMVGNGRRAQVFVDGLHASFSEAFEQETKELEVYKARKTGERVGPLEPWELAYWSEKMQQECCAFDQEALRPYFSVESVVRGLFQIVETLYSLRFCERPTHVLGSGSEKQQNNERVEVWHPGVKFFEVWDAVDGRLLGSFYTDWHPRETKRSGAWMDNLFTGGPYPDGSFEPHVGLVCGNLSPAVDGKPALLNHQEVRTIFHEFGHLLHHLLAEVSIKSLSGTSVAWDFVELPSQILENWCWKPEALDLFARHFETGNPLPSGLLESLLASRTYREATGTMRQLLFAKTDLELHRDGLLRTNLSDLDVALRDRLRDYVPRTKTPIPSIISQFTHIFGDPVGYAAAYYSYKWAEMLEADAFTKFEKEGILNPSVGREFREKILSKGNVEPPQNLFRDFVGRDPDPHALLKRAGLGKVKTTSKKY